MAESTGILLVIGGIFGIAIIVAIIAAIATVVSTAASLQKPDGEDE